MILSALGLFCIDPLQRGLKRFFSIPFHKSRDPVFFRRFKYSRSGIIIYYQLCLGIILPDTLKSAAFKAKKHATLYLHRCRITYFFQIKKAVISYQIHLFELILKFFIPLSSIALPISRILCLLVSFIAVKHDMVQTAVCLECIQEKLFDPLIFIYFIFDIYIQPVFLIIRRLFCHIPQRVLKLHIGLIKILMDILGNI